MTGRLERGIEDRDVALAARIAWLLDSAFIDPILGFVLPGAGDVLAAVAGLYIVAIAARKKVPRVVIARMLVNLAVDAGVGAIPLAGDLFDLGFKANQRNLDLLRARHGRDRGRPADWFYVVAAAALVVAALALPIVLGIWLIRAVF